MTTRVRLAGALGAVLLGAATWRVDAHKPITSPYTFTEDVLPILRDRCATCHFAGGPAPMALTTPEETVPWGESIRLELIAGHMPPWSATSNGARLRHAEGLSARELNVLLTWVTGGTPINAPPPPAPAAAAAWSLGTPDAIVPLPEVNVASDQAEITKEFVLPLDAASRRPIRAVDLNPGTRSLVRSAQISVKTAATGGDIERLIALWVPGDTPLALPDGASFDVPADADLVVRVRYKKTWEHEREAMSDRSTLAIYYANASGAPVRTFRWAKAPAAPDSPGVGAGGLVGGGSLAAGTRLLAIYPTPAAAGATITIDAMPEGGVSQRILEFSPQRGWERRYWLDRPIVLPNRTTLQFSAKFPQLPSQALDGSLVVLNIVR
jgi:hypothetical protein